MVSEIRLYFEGDKSLRSGFREFFSGIYASAKERRCRVQLVAAGSSPVQEYRNALDKHPKAWNILLLDSDEPHTGALAASLCQKERLDSGSIFWMVEVMEAWFLADIEKLRAFYGQKFRENVLRGNPNVELIPKNDVYRRLEEATAGTAKGKYHKTKHAPTLLRLIRSDSVRKAAPNCHRIFERVLERLAE
jgi:hypothetical protein